MFTAKQTFKVRGTAIKILKRYLKCRRTDSVFTLCHPCHRKNYSLACWVTLSPVSQRWEIHFRSNRLTVCDFNECDTFNVFIKDHRKLWGDLVTPKKHVNDKRIAVMQQMVENQEPLSRDALHPGGNVDGLMEKLFGVKS